MHLFRNFFLKLFGLVAVGGVVALFVTSGGVVSNPRFDSIGTSVDPGAAYASGDMAGILSQLSAAGATYVRQTMDWSQVEISQGVYNWESPIPYAAVLAAEKSQGFTVILELTGAPAYLGSPADSTQFLLRWAAFVQAAVDQFGDQVDIWEIGHRLNTSTGMSAYMTPADPGSSSAPDPALYAKMLKVAAKVIRDADPNDQIWMGSLVSATSSNCSMNPLTFLLEVNGAKGWGSFDSIEYTPERGAISAETAATSVSSACGSSLPTTSTTLSGEVQSVQDLARQLGGKDLRIEDLGWSGDEIAALASGRSISADQVLADELTRASVILAGSNDVDTIFWQKDVNNAIEMQALTNMNNLLKQAKFESQPQGQNGSVMEYRFSKGSQWNIFAWRTQDGDNAIPVSLLVLPVGSLQAYASDAASLTSGGISIPVDGNGTATLMLNERPVIFSGTTSDFGTSLQQDAAQHTDLWKYQLQLAAHRQVNNAKAAMLHAIENLFESAKDKAVQWGEDKLNSILNQ